MIQKQAASDRFGRAKCVVKLVGARGFEPPTPCAQGRCATRLRYAPTRSAGLILKYFPTLFPLPLSISDLDRAQTVHRDRVYVRGDVHTNTVESAFSLLKRGIVGSWHKISAKHLAAYLDEMTFRFNRRKNANLFLDTLRHMVSSPVLTFEKLTA